jgi:hypothetical protein
MATATQTNATFRTVVLLRSSEKKRLQKLAREQNVSASEVVRRLIHASSEQPAKEVEDTHAMFAEMNQALDIALEAVRSARIEVAENNRKIRERREQNS